MWYRIRNESILPTPSLVVHPDRIRQNIMRMASIAGDPVRLRTHVKTHKTGEVVKMQLEYGITRFKCATLAEVEMTAAAGGKDILLAYPLLGPGISQFLDLRRRHPEVRMAVTVDSREALNALCAHAEKEDQQVAVFVDIDNGMHRTGIAPSAAGELIGEIADSDQVSFAGLHVYDGHIHHTDPDERRKHCDNDFQSVHHLLQALEGKGIRVDELACGGTPTFPIHAIYPDRTLCPGTPLLWDAGYQENFPDLDFLPAAVLAGRVISKPEGNLCIDLGHKSMASEMEHPRVRFMEIEPEQLIMQNEEHLVISPGKPSGLNIGDLVYALPVHICPTMALHSMVYVAENGNITGFWKVVARDRDHHLSV